MSAKATTVYKCSQCASTFPKWSGQCSICSAWGTLEKSAGAASGRLIGASLSEAMPGEIVALSAVTQKQADRFSTGIAEFDRCLGGGIVPGSVMLLGGDPGVGKSTLALQVAAGLLAQDR